MVISISVANGTNNLNTNRKGGMTFTFRGITFTTSTTNPTTREIVATILVTFPEAYPTYVWAWVEGRSPASISTPRED